MIVNRKRSSAGLARFDVLDDEELLARLNQSELPTGDLLDRRRILGQAPCVLAQARVLRPRCPATARAPGTAAAPASSPAAPCRRRARQSAARSRPPAAGIAAVRRLRGCCVCESELGASGERFFTISQETCCEPCATIPRFDREYTRKIEFSCAFRRRDRLTTIGVGVDADAAALARTLVEERLAACVNVLPPMTSLYRWEGASKRTGTTARHQNDPRPAGRARGAGARAAPVRGARIPGPRQPVARTPTSGGWGRCQVGGQIGPTLGPPQQVRRVL